jgi:hypothetical protein
LGDYSDFGGGGFEEFFKAFDEAFDSLLCGVVDVKKEEIRRIGYGGCEL